MVARVLPLLAFMLGVSLGAGAPLFAPGHPRVELRRTDVRLFDSGIVEDCSDWIE